MFGELQIKLNTEMNELTENINMLLNNMYTKRKDVETKLKKPIATN